MLLNCEQSKLPTIPHGMSIDWQKMLMEFRRSGITFSAISEYTGLPQCRLKGWFLHGYEPRFIDGNIVILFYWNKVAPNKLLPLKHLELSAAKLKQN
ncbi:MAG: hypothetical protein ACMZ64_07645 [Oleiphilus sp.]